MTRTATVQATGNPHATPTRIRVAELRHEIRRLYQQAKQLEKTADNLNSLLYTMGAECVSQHEATEFVGRHPRIAAGGQPGHAES